MWENGRQLASITTGGSTYTYSYDGDGIRTQKVVDGVTHTYVTQNGKVMRETIGTGATAKVLDFIYDNNGKPFALIYTNGSASPVTYYYVLNLQGDVVALMTAERSIVAQYAYNAWGELLSVTDEDGEAITSASHIANLNPIRYRGYYYDTETGFYYLRSRYYDPVNCRFVNADGYASTGQGFLGCNMFAYCNNDPIAYIDYSGRALCQNTMYVLDDHHAMYHNTPESTNNIVDFFSPNTHTVSGQFQDGIFRGSGSVTGGYSDIMVRGQGDKKEYPTSKEPSMTVGVFAKLSVANATGKVGIGNDDVALSLKGVGDVLTASAQAGLKYQDGLGLTAKAKAAVASGRATLELSIFGWQIEAGVTGDVLSVGAEATIGIFDGAFEAKANASLGVGGGFVIRIKPPQ